MGTTGHPPSGGPGPAPADPPAPRAVHRRLAYLLCRHHGRLAPLLPRGHHPYRVPGGWIYLDVRESSLMLARALWAYEAGKVANLRHLLHGARTFVDVGANKGDFTVLAAGLLGPGGRVLAVEPEPDNVAWLERSVARNRFTTVSVAAVAASDHQGEATLFLGRRSGTHSLLGGPDGDGRSITVPLRTVDELVADAGLGPVDVMKIDVEGAEEAVLRGAAGVLGGDRPMAVMVDLHPRRADVGACLALLEGHGFSLRDPDDVVRPLAGRPPDLAEVVAVR